MRIRHQWFQAICFLLYATGLAVSGGQTALAAAISMPIPVVAAESTYGVIAQAIGGRHVAVDSLIQNPNVDPHQFEATPDAARKVAQARVVLLNGLGYDDWMSKLIAAGPARGRQVVIAAELDPRLVTADKNPHVFYDPQVALLVAARVAALLQRDDPLHAADYANNLRSFQRDLSRVDAAAARLRARYPGLTVTATEPVFGYMLRQLGWKSEGEALQLNVMNDTEPAPAEVARYENALRRRKVALLIYNRQVSGPLTRRMRDIARQSGVPTVGVDEFVPPHTGYVQWQVQTLEAVERALAGAGKQ